MENEDKTENRLLGAAKGLKNPGKIFRQFRHRREHDVIWAGPSDPHEVSREDKKKLLKYGWNIIDQWGSDQWIFYT